MGDRSACVTTEGKMPCNGIFIVSLDGSGDFFFELAQRTGYKQKIWPRGRLGKLLTDAPTRQISAQWPGRGGKANSFGHGGAVVFAIFGKDEVLLSKPRADPKY